MIILSVTLFSLSGIFPHFVHHPGSMSYSCGTPHIVVLPRTGSQCTGWDRTGDTFTASSIPPGKTVC